MARPRSWTDDDLRAQVPVATSWRDLRDRLGLVGGGSTMSLLRRRSAELGLDTSHLPEPGAMPRRWTDQQLAEAVAAATSLNGVFTHLGLSVGGSVWRRMQDHIVRLGLDTSHWNPRGVQPGRRGAKRPSPIDDDRPPRPLEEVLVRDPTYAGCSSQLRDRLVDEGLLEWRCAACGLQEWKEVRAPLQLDHINGDPTDNRLVNLRLLCPNCHALTPTYCGRNIGTRYSSGSGSGRSASAP